MTRNAILTREEVFIPESSAPQSISKTSPSLYLLRKIRNEAHRFAINFHKNKRDNNLLSSVLFTINGLGPIRIKKIWEIYNSLEEIKRESNDTIRNKTKIPINIIKEMKVKI